MYQSPIDPNTPKHLVEQENCTGSTEKREKKLINSKNEPINYLVIKSV